MNASLYIHVPYCARKCDYCDFFSIPIGTQRTAAFFSPYVENLVREIELRKELYGIEGWKTVYIGGGTPSLLEPTDIRAIGEAVSRDLAVESGNPPEWTIEANPEDISENWLSACADAGINRLSLGIQSMHDVSLASVGRRGSRAGNLKALDLVSQVWKGRLSLDLIAGLPSQTKESLLEDIDEIIGYSADHISLYSLTVEEGTKLDERLSVGDESVNGVDGRFSIPEGDEATELWIAGRNALERAGYDQYEVSNFARQGCESKHNLTYWNLETYIGAGTGATGTIITGDTAFRYTNALDIDSWRNNPQGTSENEHISRIDCIKESILMGFRLVEGISRPTFKIRYGMDILDVIGTTAERWRADRLLRIDSDHIRLTKEGLLILNRFLVDCLQEIDLLIEK